MCQIDNRINNGQTPTDLGQFESFDYDYVYDYILCIGCVHVYVCVFVTQSRIARVDLFYKWRYTHTLTPNEIGSSSQCNAMNNETRLIKMMKKQKHQK